MAQSAIEWTDATWNPVVGCSIVSAGCTNCYAMRLAARLEAMGCAKYNGLTRKSGGRAKWTGDVRLDETALPIPKKWKKPRRIFVNSMGDLFHPNIPFAFIKKVWLAMCDTPHQYQILTKHPARMAEFVEQIGFLCGLNKSNIWLGTSIESNAVKEREEHLRKCLGYPRFISFEPLIGSAYKTELYFVEWVIVGGESGPGARAINKRWVDEIFDRCQATKTAFFFKQWGGSNKKAAGRLYRGREWNEMPARPV